MYTWYTHNIDVCLCSAFSPCCLYAEHVCMYVNMHTEMYACMYACMHECVCVCLSVCLSLSVPFFVDFVCCECVTSDTERVQNRDIVAHQPILFFDGYMHVSVPPVRRDRGSKRQREGGREGGRVFFCDGKMNVSVGPVRVSAFGSLLTLE